MKSNCPNCGAPGVLYARQPGLEMFKCEYCESIFCLPIPREEQNALVAMYADGRPVEILRRPPRIPTKETR